MDLHVWLAYLVAAWAIAISPGPGAVLSMSHGMSYGVRRTFATILGLQAGVAFILLVAGVGIGAVLLASEKAFLVVKVVGAAYLLWLGVKQWRAPVQAGLIDHAGGHGVDLSARQRFARGFFTDATNPKGIVFMVAVLPQFIRPDRSLGLQLLILLVTTVVVDVIVMNGYAFLAASLRQWIASVRAQRVRNRIAGGVLIALGASLAFVGRAEPV
ncbi:MAG: lysine transporter LysE [Burkholderiaceae bacterium]|jgi:homoserine/homoserine lactone efflux protein|nr:MAG: lysine transporter LysE [Burkholderiaceae bacterium]